jgi:acyl-CoA reductase-like NAD-dependent aldehyde dehydrogenase
MKAHSELLPAARAFLAKPATMLIGGQWREAASGEALASPDPATGETIALFPAGGQADAEEAVGAARRAFPAWKKVTPYDRGRLLQKAASLIEKHGEELAQLITIENGKPIAEAKREVSTAVSWTEYYAGWTTKLVGDTIPLSLPGQFLNYTTRDPLGVVAGITPPNYPLTMPLYKAVPALATGNTIIIKPSEDTSLVALRLGELLCDAGLPDGAFNDLPDAIAKGNDSPFGLAAGVWTRDIRKAHQAAAALDAGTVWMNCYNAFDNASPWGGFKQSGWGREKGPYGLDLFTQIKSVIINFT